MPPIISTDHGKTSPPSIIDGLPTDIARNRVVGSDEAARFCNYSIPHWGRLHRAGKVPAPIKISARKLGWRIGDLADFVAARSTALVREAA